MEWILSDTEFFIELALIAVWVDAIVTLLLARKLKKGNDKKWHSRGIGFLVKILLRKFGLLGALLGGVANSMVVVVASYVVNLAFGNILHHVFIYGLLTGMFTLAVIMNFGIFLLPPEKVTGEDSEEGGGNPIGGLFKF